MITGRSKVTKEAFSGVSESDDTFLRPQTLIFAESKNATEPPSTVNSEARSPVQKFSVLPWKSYWSLKFALDQLG